MPLDISTLYLVATLVAAMLGGLLLFFWRQEQIAALGWWGAAYLLGGAVIGVWALAGIHLPQAASIALTCAGFVACGMVWNASRVFHGRGVSWPGIAIGAILWAAADYFLARESGLRVVAGAAIVAAYASLTANELAKERRKSLQSRWPAIMVPMLHGIVLMLPILLGDFMRPDGTALDSAADGSRPLRSNSCSTRLVQCS